MNIIDTIKAQFTSLRPLEVSEFLLMAATVVALPWKWQLALYGVILLMGNTIVKCICQRQVGNSRLTRWGLLSFLAAILLVGWYGVSLLWTANIHEGSKIVLTMTSMVLTSLVFIFSDMGYLKTSHLRTLLYLFAISLAALFLVRLGINIKRVITEDITFTSRMTFGFDKRHHSYISMYVLVALWGLFYEQIRHWGDYSTALRRIGFALLVVLLVADLVIINSRAGILFFYLTVFLMCGYVFVKEKRRKSALMSLAISLVLIVGVHFSLPKTQNRVDQTSVTAEAASKGTTEQAARKDKRLAIWQASIELIKDNYLLGVGIGDRFDSLVPLFKAHDDQESIDRRKNCHNQFLDTLASTGIVGLIILCALFVALLMASLRQRSWLLFVYTLMIGFNCLFETLFDRQMGLLFFALALGLILINQPKTSQQ